jgi:quinol monooxygenase YgiN
MLVVHVNVFVKPDCVDAFTVATLKNAAASLKEPGIARFDVIRDTQASNHFVLVEVYRTTNAPADHKATPHYAEWRDTVADMMLEPRTSVRFENVFPADQGWNMPAGS